MFSKYKQRFTPLIAIIARPFLSWNPTILTILSLIAAILFFTGIVTHIYLLSVISVVGFVFDMLDGYVARYQKKVSKIGAFLDSSFDRVSDFFLVAGFGVAHLVPWGLVVIVVFTSFFISYLRTLGELTFGKTPISSTGLMQRTERIVLLIFAFLLFLAFPGVMLFGFSLLPFAFGLLGILNCITIVQRFATIYTHA